MRWIAFVLALVVAHAVPAGAQELKTEQDKVLYALGVQLASQLAPFALTPAEVELVKAGMLDAALNRPHKAEPREYMPKILDLRNQRVSVAAAAEKKSGEAYLAKAAAEPGAKKLPSGVIITTLKPGNGPSPKATDKVKVHYHGTLIDGKVFDSSVERGEPATFGVDEVIPGWTEVLQLMKEGDKWQVYIPSKLAYGPRGAGPQIGPNTTLVFDVELLSIEKP